MSRATSIVNILNFPVMLAPYSVKSFKNLSNGREGPGSELVIVGPNKFKLTYTTYGDGAQGEVTIVVDDKEVSVFDIKNIPADFFAVLKTFLAKYGYKNDWDNENKRWSEADFTAETAEKYFDVKHPFIRLECVFEMMENFAENYSRLRKLCKKSIVFAYLDEESKGTMRKIGAEYTPANVVRAKAAIPAGREYIILNERIK